VDRKAEGQTRGAYNPIAWLTIANQPMKRQYSAAMRKIIIACSLLLMCVSINSAHQSKTQLVMLGTGTPNADPDRAGPAVAIVVNDVPYVVDAGPGVVRRAAAAARNGVKGLSVEKLRRLFITHLHSDHTVGLPDFIFTPAVLERDAMLEIYGPPGTKRMADLILKAFAEDITIRLKGLEPAMPRGYDVRTQDVKPGVIYKDANVTVKAFAVKHGSWKYAYGYRFEAADRVITGMNRSTQGSTRG
jgi:ribonuclease Z